MSPMNDRDRHSRSILFPGIGEAGQERIGRTSIAFVGVGAVGAAAAEIAVRAGFGRVTVIDRDVVEHERDPRALPKILERPAQHGAQPSEGSRRRPEPVEGPCPGGRDLLLLAPERRRARRLAHRRANRRAHSGRGILPLVEQGDPRGGLPRGRWDQTHSHTAAWRATIAEGCICAKFNPP